MSVASTIRRLGDWLDAVVSDHRRIADLSASGGLRMLDEGDGRVVTCEIDGIRHLRPADDSYHLYFGVPERMRSAPLFVEVEYLGCGHGPFRLQYPSQNRAGSKGGGYTEAPQFWSGQEGDVDLRRCRYHLDDFDGSQRQNYGANFRLIQFEGTWIRNVRVSNHPFADSGRYAHVVDSPLLRKRLDRFHRIHWLFVEVTNLCNFSCTFCPDEIMTRPRGHMKTEEALRIFDAIAETRDRIGPVWPVKLHQMGEPTIHPGIVDIVAHAERLGVSIELNTNCSLLKPKLVEGLYGAGLSNLVLSYLNHTPEAFGTRKARNSALTFETYRGDVERAIETKFVLGARTSIELHVANAKHTGGFDELVHSNEEARAELESWLAFARGVEERNGLPPSGIDVEKALAFKVLDEDENGGVITILPGVDLMWKRIHTWGNVIRLGSQPRRGDGYCMAPYDQCVIEYNGDVTACCTDHDGTIKLGNVFEQSLADIWQGPKLRTLREEQASGILSYQVCRVCQGWER